MRVGFLFLGPYTHILHGASIAFELSTLPGFEVTLLVSCQMNADAVQSLAAKYGGQCRVEWLQPTWTHRLIRRFKKRLHPRTRNVLAHNRERLNEYDALVSTDGKPVKTSPPQPLLIHFAHGVGDRARGIYPEMNMFDFLLVPGRERWRRMEALGYVSEGKGAIIGSPKFDIARLDRSPPDAVFPNRNPVVLYNPHFNQRESSWHLWGKRVLDYFVENPDFNLIFAPHMLLLAKQRNPVPKRYLHRSNILIDVDSPALADMSYTRLADIYLGDVSSQVYEFLAYRHRPCVFLNSHRVTWQGADDFKMWRMGAVVDDIEQLGAELRSAGNKLNAFLPEQESLLGNTFSLQDEPAGRRGARAIAEFLQARGLGNKSKEIGQEKALSSESAQG